MNLCFDPPYGDAQRREKIYSGEVIVLSATPETLNLVSHARRLIEDAFAPADPRRAQDAYSVDETVAKLTRLKPHFIHHAETRTLLRAVLLAYGCDPDETYQDVPRLRCAFPANYLSSGIAYAHHPHRDTWYSAPMCQFNWWMPIYDFVAEQGMAFHPRYWERGIANGSAKFNYYRWNAEGRKNAAEHVTEDTRVQPRPEEPIELEPEICCVVPAGGIILFSAAQLHSTIVNRTRGTRWSIDFRTVNLIDLRQGRGAINCDSHCTGTSLRDFRRVRDFAAMPEVVVRSYDTDGPAEGVAIFEPENADAATA